MPWLQPIHSVSGAHRLIAAHTATAAAPDITWYDHGLVRIDAAKHMVHVPEMDAEHEVLFAWYHAFTRSGERDEMLLGLATYAAAHFANEEKLIARLGIPVGAHASMHASLNQRLAHLISKRSHASRVACQTLVYDWLVEHIMHEDAAMAKQIRDITNRRKNVA